MFSDALRRMRKQSKLTQTELADALNVSQSTVAGWESGARKPDLDTIVRIAEYFQTTTDELIDRNTNEKSDSELMQIPQIAMMAREMGEMTPEQRDQMLAIGRALMKEFFGIEADA